MQKNQSSASNEIKGLRGGSVTAFREAEPARSDIGHVPFSAVSIGTGIKSQHRQEREARLLNRGRIGQGEGANVSSVARSVARPPARAGQHAPHRLALPSLAFDADDEQIRRAAFACSSSCQEVAQCSSDEMEAIGRTRTICRILGIEPPTIKEPAGREQVSAAIRRAACPIWWRRRLRVLVARRVEAKAIKTGEVHRTATAYCSVLGLVSITVQTSGELTEYQPRRLDIVENMNLYPYEKC